MPSAVLLLAATSVLASDRELQRTLLQAGCVNPRITIIATSPILTYKVNCMGTSHKVIVVNCGKSDCEVQRAWREDE
jgi:hypothetical protein